MQSERKMVVLQNGKTNIMIEKFNMDLLNPKMAPWKKRIADFLLNNLTFLRIRRTNRLLKKYMHLEGGDFIQKVIDDIKFEYNVHHSENIPPNGAVTICANHPGGADVLGTICGLWNVRKDFSILANRLICVKPVMDIVIPVDLLKSKDKVNMNAIDKSYQDGRAVVFYAAGKNSRYNEEGELVDRRWRTTFLDYAYKYKTPLLVFKINSSNTPFFYKVAKFREKRPSLKKVPLENMFQLRELFKQKGRDMDIYTSRLIPFEEWSPRYKPGDLKSNRLLADQLYDTVYSLSETNQSVVWDK